MRDYLDSDDLYATIGMQRTADSRLFLVVEGDTDVRALNRRINDADCDLICGYNKPAVVKAMRRLEESDPDRCVALVDRDFDDWLGISNPANVFMTDLYDRETDLLLKCELLADYLAVVRDEHKERAFLTRTGEVSVLHMIVKGTAIVGKLRWVSRRESLNLTLSRFPMNRVLGTSAIASEVEIAKFALQRTRQTKVTLGHVLRSYSRMAVADEQRLCNGHDLVSAVVASATLWARRKLARRELTTFVLATVRCDVLQQLDWFTDLSRWAASRGFRLWNCGPARNRGMEG